MEITIHLGMHKTGSSFLQKHFFQAYREQSGYFSLRDDAHEFLKDILYSGASTWDLEQSKKLFNEALLRSEFSGERMTIVEETLCGDPYLNAFNRIEVFNRLNRVFPGAKYVLILREQESMTQTLYLQYVKLGGTCSWREFLANDQPPLLFSRAEYLCYAQYAKEICSQVGKSRFKCVLYESMLENKTLFLRALADFNGFKLDDSVDVNGVASKKSNKSLSPRAARVLRQMNKLMRSYRNPHLLLPNFSQRFARNSLVCISSPKKEAIPLDVVSAFCESSKKCNSELSEFVGFDVSKYGY